MRLIIKILLGLILFNAMLVYFVGFFPASTATGGSQEYLNKYKDVGGIIATFIVDAGGVFILTMIGAFIIGNYPVSQCMGAAALIGIIAGLWGSASYPISVIMNDPSLSLGGLGTGTIFYNALVIGIAVIASFSIIEIFTFKGDAE
jgi:hypothetical protein